MTALAVLAPLFIPSPSRNVWHLGPIPLRAYALCIIAGIVVGMVIATRRWRARGGTSDGLESVVVVAIPFGIVGARVYHVITDYELYFGHGRHPVDALKIWQGGLGIWGAVALGALGGWLVARRRGIAFAALLDACAPGIAVAQGIGRLGNWFNSELFGRPTTLPWGLEIAPGFRPAGFGQYATFHPTFLYELVWDVAVAVAVILLDRRFRLGHGKVFTLYVLLYTAGRFWIEALRIDTVNEIGGFRLNNYTSVVVFVGAALVLAWLVKNRPGREAVVEAPAGSPVAGTADGDDATGAADEGADGTGTGGTGTGEGGTGEGGTGGSGTGEGGTGGGPDALGAADAAAADEPGTRAAGADETVARSLDDASPRRSGSTRLEP